MLAATAAFSMYQYLERITMVRDNAHVSLHSCLFPKKKRLQRGLESNHYPKHALTMLQSSIPGRVDLTVSKYCANITHVALGAERTEEICRPF